MSHPNLGADRASMLLRTVFTIAPIAFGLDKLFDILTDWEQYLAPWINDIVPGSAHQAMLAVGVIEIVAGIAIAVVPHRRKRTLRGAVGARLGDITLIDGRFLARRSATGSRFCNTPVV